MKHLKTILILSLGLLITINSFADTISVKEAKTVAKNFILETSSLYYEKNNDNIDLILIKSKNNEKNEPYYYIFDIKPQGFIIVSAETAFNPILGYNLTEDNHIEKENPVFESWMQYYADYIDYIRSNNLSQTKAMKEKWERYNTTSFDYLKATPKDNIEPLLTNTWNQDYPYNYFSPLDEEGPGGRVYAGCVATAMSMIMYHYKYPKQGTGSHTYYAENYGSLTANFGATEYDWDAMDDFISSGSNPQTIFSIAELQYHCGVSVNMMYSPNGSGAYSDDVPNALKNYFGYSNAEIAYKDFNSLTSWNNILTEQLENHHPMYYSGYSNDGGHAFCLDGKQGEDMFHFNFGWSGYQNGFYYLEGDGAVGNFSSDQKAVINFYPPESQYPYECENKTLNTGGGIINDNGMPYKSYPTNADCRWLLVPKSVNDSVQQFDFELLKLNLEAGDQLTIYDGPDENSPIIGTYTDVIPEEPIHSTNDSVLVVFTTNDNETEHDGFRLRYKAKLPKYCSGLTTYTDLEGNITDGSGDFYYANSNMCQYLIKPENADKITLTFNTFDLAEGDFIVLYEMNPTHLITTLTHESNPTSYVSNTGKMMVMFRNTNLFNADGFEASYVAEKIGTEDIPESFEKLNLYPNPASDKITLEMEIKNEKAVKVSICNIDGKVIANDIIQNMAGMFYKEFDLSKLTSGIYLMVIESSKDKTTQRFMVK